MPSDACVLTTRDFTILEVMLDRCLERDGPVGSLLRRKVNGASIVFSEDIPPHVATLGSRVVYRLDGGEPESSVLSHEPMAASGGPFLQIVTPAGLALLGLSEGQEIAFHTEDGLRRVLLKAVLDQPEAERRERVAMSRLAASAMHRNAHSVMPGAVTKEG